MNDDILRNSYSNRALSEHDYVRARLDPALSDTLYIHLSDLVLFVRQLEIPDGANILDFGAGGAPYRPFFPDANYFTADVADDNNPDYVISSEGTIGEHDAFFDVILSTQVLEHVEDYRGYLRECWRLLKPGGTLVLTVPGMYEEHACPGDFQRWMIQGIRRDVEQSGFRVTKITKLTTGPRAIFFFIERLLDTMQSSRKTAAGLSLFLARLVLSPFRGVLRLIIDRLYSDQRVVDANSPHAVYLGLAVEATKDSNGGN